MKSFNEFHGGAIVPILRIRVFCYAATFRGAEIEKDTGDCCVTERMSKNIEVSSNQLGEVYAVGSYIK